MQVITIDSKNFLAGHSENKYINDGGFANDAYGFETNRGSQKGLLLPGRTPDQFSTNIADNIQAFCIYYYGSAVKYASIGSAGKIYSTVPGPAPDHTLKYTDSGKTYNADSDIICFGDYLYITSTTDITKSNLTIDSVANNWWTNTLGKAALTAGVPHKIIEFQGKLYIIDGNKLHETNGVTGTFAKLTLPTGFILTDITVFNNKIVLVATMSSTGSTWNTATKMYIWDGYSSSWNDEINLNEKVLTMKVCNGTLYCFGYYSLNYFTGSGIKKIKRIEADPNWHQVAIKNSKIYFLSFYGIACYDPEFDSLTTPVVLSSSDVAKIKALIIGYSDYIDYSFETNKFYNAKINSLGGTFNSNLYTFPDSVYIRKVKIIYSTPLTSGCTNTITLTEESGRYYQFTSSYAVDGAIVKKVENPDFQCENFQLSIPFSVSTANKPIREIKIYYEPAEQSDFK